MVKGKKYFQRSLLTIMIILLSSWLWSCNRQKEFESKAEKVGNIKCERKYYMLDTSRVVVNQIFKNFILQDSLLPSFCKGFELVNIDNYYSYKETIRVAGSNSELYRFECSKPYLGNEEFNYDFFIEYPSVQMDRLFNVLLYLRNIEGNYHAAYIAWNNRKEIYEVNGKIIRSSAPPVYKWEVGKSTVTLISNIPYPEIKKLYPKFTGDYIYEQLDTIYFNNQKFTIDQKEYYDNINFSLKSYNKEKEIEKKFPLLDTIEENTAIPIQ